jgi:hypothetical protein
VPLFFWYFCTHLKVLNSFSSQTWSQLSYSHFLVTSQIRFLITRMIFIIKENHIADIMWERVTVNPHVQCWLGFQSRNSQTRGLTPLLPVATKHFCCCTWTSWFSERISFARSITVLLCWFFFHVAYEKFISLKEYVHLLIYWMLNAWNLFNKNINIHTICKRKSLTAK